MIQDCANNTVLLTIKYHRRQTKGVGDLKSPFCDFPHQGKTNIGKGSTTSMIGVGDLIKVRSLPLVG